MQRYHVLNQALVKKCTMQELETILTDFGLSLPIVGKRVLKKDTVKAVGDYIKSNDYSTHTYEYQSCRYRSIEHIPKIYRTREVRLASSIFSLFEDQDKTFTRCLLAAKNVGDLNHIPMNKFSFDQRRQIIEVSCSFNILRNLPADEIFPWLLRWPLALQFIPYDKQSAEMCHHIVSQTGWALPYCSKQFVTPALEEIAVRNTPYAIQWVNTVDQIHYERLCSLAVASDGWTIELIKNPSEALRLAALTQDWTCHIVIPFPLSAAEQNIVDMNQSVIKTNIIDLIVIDE